MKFREGPLPAWSACKRLTTRARPEPACAHPVSCTSPYPLAQLVRKTEHMLCSATPACCPLWPRCLLHNLACFTHSCGPLHLKTSHITVADSEGRGLKRAGIERETWGQPAVLSPLQACHRECSWLPFCRPKHPCFLGDSSRSFEPGRRGLLSLGRLAGTAKDPNPRSRQIVHELRTCRAALAALPASPAPGPPVAAAPATGAWPCAQQNCSVPRHGSAAEQEQGGSKAGGASRHV